MNTEINKTIQKIEYEQSTIISKGIERYINDNLIYIFLFIEFIVILNFSIYKLMTKKSTP